MLPRKERMLNENVLRIHHCNEQNQTQKFPENEKRKEIEKVLASIARHSDRETETTYQRISLCRLKVFQLEHFY